MRNLKRALSLVLATAMLVGMMVFGASAAGYKDSDTVNNDTAVEVLSALDIVGGDENGNFRPASTLTRAEFCVMIANVLTGGTFDKALFEGTATPFTDIQGHWGAPFIAFCYSSGVIAGTTATTFSPDANLTSAQAEAILLSVLGYNKNGEFAANDQFELNVTSWAQRVGLMENLTVAANAAITRDNTAQLMFNTLTRAVPVEYNDSFGVYYNALGRGTDWFAGVQFRYNETLGYTNFDLVYDSASEDDFYRLGTEWALGTLPNGVGDLDDNGNIHPHAARIREHITTELNTPVLSYTTSVKEREIYRGLSLNLKQNTNKLPVYLDGVSLGLRAITDDRDKNLEDSGLGVLTEVYKEGESYRIVIINTFLARATSDYNAKNDQVNLKVYKFDVDEKTVAKVGKPEPVLAVKGEDVAAAIELVQDDFVLVNIADGEIKIISDPEIISSATVSAFSKDSYVITGGVTYNYAEALQYDVDTLKNYDNPNLRDVTYTLYLDPYGNLIGINLDEEANQYLFITGYDVNGSNIANANATANAIFLDGTMATITVDMNKSVFADSKAHPTNWNGDASDWHDSSLHHNYYYAGNVLENTWYTYSVNDAGVYTIKYANDQAWSHYGSGYSEDGVDYGKINSNKPALSAVMGFEYTNADKDPDAVGYGNDNSVYIAAETENIGGYSAISGVDSVTTGIKNVAMNVANDSVSGKGYGPNEYSTGVYAVFKNGYVVAAVVVGEDMGTRNDHVFYALGSVKLEEYSDGSWTWQVDGILDGKEATIYKTGDSWGDLDLTEVQQDRTHMESWEDFEADYAYQISNDADGYVNDIDVLTRYNGGFPGAEEKIASKNVEVRLLPEYGGPYELHIEGWTLYLTQDATNGVVVASDCPTALVEYNSVKDKYEATYYDDARTAIRAMESSVIKSGKIVASINKDRQITSLVIVVYDYGISYGNDNPPSETDNYVLDARIQAGSGDRGQLWFDLWTKNGENATANFTYTVEVKEYGEPDSAYQRVGNPGTGELNGNIAHVYTGNTVGYGRMQYKITVYIGDETISDVVMG